MTTWAFMFEHPGADPTTDTVVIDHHGQRTFLVPVAEPDAAKGVVEELIDQGVALVELCGGFTLADAAHVVDVVAGRAAVGHVTYAAESLEAAHRYAQLADRAEP